MWVYPQDEIESHRQELQQSVFELWSVLPGKEPCGYFQWLHGPLWRPREQAQPSLRRWVKETPHGSVPYYKDPAPLLKKALFGNWERRSHRWPPTPGVALWEGTLLCVRVSISRSLAKGE